jgi:hypothetical protein
MKREGDRFKCQCLLTEEMGTDAAAAWQNSTVLIRNRQGKQGTGFFVLDPLTPGPPPYTVHVLIVTNKHVIDADPEGRKSATSAHLSLIRKNPDGSFTPASGDYPLRTRDGVPIWREHPDENVDVLAIDAGPLVSAIPGMVDTLLEPKSLCSAADWSRYDVRAGQNVLVVGYPAGIREVATNRPIVRHGIISSDPQATFTTTRRKGDVEEERIVRGFIIDCQGLRGSSGSPVILDTPPTGVPRIVASTGGRVSPDPVAIGIGSEGWITELPDVLTLAYTAETIRETVQLFRS